MCRPRLIVAGVHRGHGSSAGRQLHVDHDRDHIEQGADPSGAVESGVTNIDDQGSGGAALSVGGLTGCDLRYE